MDYCEAAEYFKLSTDQNCPPRSMLFLVTLLTTMADHGVPVNLGDSRHYLHWSGQLREALWDMVRQIEKPVYADSLEVDRRTGDCDRTNHPLLDRPFDQLLPELGLELASPC
jgi:hypothetical protein